MINANYRKSVVAFWVIALALINTGCPDPDKAADEMMKKQGVNRVRKPNDYMQPGSVILVKDKRAIYADNMLDYIEVPVSNEYPILVGNEVVPAMSGQKEMKADIALKFLDSLLPVKVSSKMALSSDVKIDMISSRIKRLKIQDLRRFLNRQESSGFRDQMKMEIAKGKEVFVAYQVYIANKIKIVAAAGSDISLGAEIAKIEPLFEGAEPKFSWVKKSKSEIDINGDSYYVFGLKTARLRYDKNTNKWDVDESGFVPTGTLAAGTDDKFASSPLGANKLDFTVMSIERRNPLDNF